MDSEMVFFEIKQFSPNLNSGQIEEMPDLLNLDSRKGTMQANQAVLEYIVCLFPSSQGRISPKHLAGEL